MWIWNTEHKFGDKVSPAIPGIVEEPVEDLSQSLSPSLNNSPALSKVCNMDSKLFIQT